MLAYYIILIHTSLLLLAGTFISVKQQKWFVYYCVFAITLLAGLRGFNGTDTYSYHIMFREYKNLDFFEQLKAIEPLFVFLIAAVALFSSNSFVFTGVISILQAGILISLVKTSKEPATFLLIYIAVFFIEFEFNILRTGISLMLLMLAARYSNRDSKAIFYSISFAAMLFHFTSIIGFIYLSLSVEKKVSRKIFLILLLALLVSLIGYFIMDSSRLGKLNYYLNNFEKMEIASPGVGFFGGQILYLMLFIATFDKNKYLRQIILITTIVALDWLTLRFEYFDRIRIVFVALFLLQGIDNQTIGLRNLLKKLSLTGIVILSLYGNIVNMDRISKSTELDFFHSKSPYVPYRFFWEENQRDL